MYRGLLLQECFYDADARMDVGCSVARMYIRFNVPRNMCTCYSVENRGQILIESMDAVKVAFQLKSRLFGPIADF